MCVTKSQAAKRQIKSQCHELYKTSKSTFVTIFLVAFEAPVHLDTA